MNSFIKFELEYSIDELNNSVSTADLVAGSYDVASAGFTKAADAALILKNAPLTMMLLIELVRLIRGVWSAGVTFQITCQPTNIDRTKTVKWFMKETGATEPTATIRTITIARAINPLLALAAGFLSAADSPGTAVFGLAGITGVFVSGGGHVISPDLTTVIVRNTSSSMSIRI